MQSRNFLIILSDKINLLLLVLAAYLYQYTSGKCNSEDDGDTAINIWCSNDDVGLVTEISFLQYRPYTLNRVNIFLDGIYTHPIIDRNILKELFTPIVALTITNTRILDFKDMLVLSNVSELTIRDCSLAKIKFDDILILKQATKLNVSHNSISVLKSAKLGNEQQRMETIDLSYNLISSVPDNCFASFSHMKHLNLSHNSISYLSAAAFEGISRLESLFLSYNKLSSVANIAIKLWNLKILHVDYNYISKIEDLNAMIDLEELNLGHNEIKLLDENAFTSLSNLTRLDLSGNQITWIRAHFANNNLRELRLTDNILIRLFSHSLDGKNFTNLYINGNKYITPIQAFNNVKCDYLDLSNCDLQNLPNITFSGGTLSSINLSTNALSNIEISTFSFVNDLQEIDLSNNELRTLDFLMPGVRKLKKLHIQKNMLNKILNNTFTNTSSLEFLDLSYNVIQIIESGSFLPLSKLENLLLHNNRIFSIQVINFHGLSSLVQFDLSYTLIGNFTKAAILGLKTTTYNCSHAELSHINFDTFAEVEHIEILDLSYNSLVTFEVNRKGISSVEILYLNNNKITSISRISFAGFIELQELHLEFNNIVDVHPKAFFPLKALRVLNLSDNRDLQETGDAFSNLRGLGSLAIINNKKNFNFQRTENATIEQVDLSSCDIGDLESLYIYNINGVVNLNLSKNLIGYIDNKSFKTMPKLKRLNLSFNLIKSIEPGSFINSKKIVDLNLHRNQLSAFQHGVFQGLTGLQTLNLSNNLLVEFNPNLLHSCTELVTISLENNLITYLEFRKFVSFSTVKQFYLGGNNISCHDLASFKKYLSEAYYYNQNIITSEVANYHTANVDGVTCKPDNYTGNNDTNSTMNTIYMSKFTDTLEKISKSIDDFNQVHYVKGIFNILIVVLIASIILLLVKYVPIKRFFIKTRMPLNGNLSHSFSYSNMTQRVSNDDDYDQSLEEQRQQ